MNKLKSYIVLIVLVAFASCKEDLDVISKLTMQVSEDFIVQSVQEGPNKQVVCEGYLESTNEVLLHFYTEELKLVNTVNISEKLAFQGNLKVKSLKDEGWLISCFKASKTPTLTLFKTDANFKVIHQASIGGEHDSTFRASVRSIELARNGDYLLAIDTTGTFFSTDDVFGGIQLVRLTGELDEVFNVKSFGYFRVGLFSPRLVEMPNENLHFTASALYADGSGVHAKFVSGALSKSGDLLFDTLGGFENLRYYIDPVGLSTIGDKLLYNYTVNKDRPFYALIDPNTGLVLDEFSLDNFNVNHSTYYGMYPNYYAFTRPETSGSANALPLEIQPGQGQIMFSKSDEKLYLLTVDDQFQFAKSNLFVLPDFDKVVSYRQLYTSANTAVVAVSYSYRGKSYLNLQELNL